MKSFLFLLFTIPFLSLAQKKATDLKKDICDPLVTTTICKKKADAIFTFIKNVNPPFNWNDANNNCEDRANGLCLLLDAWGIANAKAWCFNGTTAGYTTTVNNTANGDMDGYRYHVGAIVFVKNNNNSYDTLVIDPLMDNTKLLTLKKWADSLTIGGTNFYFVTSNKRYNHEGVVLNPTWLSNEGKLKQTLKGLAGYNPGTPLSYGKLFNVKKTRIAFEVLIAKEPTEISLINCD